MKCPFCNHPESKVIDSRESGEGDIIRRRRECEACQRRYTTYERIEEILPLIVKKDGRREPYDRLKIVNGLKKACEKRPVPAEVIEGIADEIEQALQENGEKEVSSRFIGQRIMSSLQKIDPVAYVRFASVYRSFKDVNEFMEELKGIVEGKK
ncbi:MAG: transcriptional repressor NrdR [Deltaproteobacteria bacterium]|nr:transcriptional repressor NrdR [Deltaproteobacteria bacterium]